MYTYEDLEKRIAIRCADKQEFDMLKQYFESYGHECCFPEEDMQDETFYTDRCFDICDHLNEERIITCANTKWYLMHGYKIIDFSELEEINHSIDVKSFECILMAAE